MLACKLFYVNGSKGAALTTHKVLRIKLLDFGVLTFPSGTALDVILMSIHGVLFSFDWWKYSYPFNFTFGAFLESLFYDINLD